jgi:nickel/cobalt exporter
VVLTVAAFGMTGVLQAPIASAHPLGNFTVNRYGGIVVSPERIELTYVVDMAEIPTFQSLPQIDADGDGAPSPAELQAWAGAIAQDLLAGLSLSVDGREVALTVGRSTADLLPGQGGLHVLFLRTVFAGATTTTHGRIVYTDVNYADRIGWKEVTARATDGVTLAESDVPEATISGELRSYPQDLLASPPDVTAASLMFRPATGPARTETSERERPASAGRSDSGGSFAGLVTRDLTLPAVVLSLLLAFGFGAVHALGPGHGKTIMAAYLVGTGARVRQAVSVGVAVTLMHTASVIGLGLAALYASSLFPSERVYPWLGLAAGVVVVALGAALLASRIRARGRGAEPWHPHVHPHVHGKSSATEDPPPAPCPAGPDRRSVRPTGLSRRGLVALAVSGGLLPSPTALVVLLGAISLHRLAYGLALIGAFSLGLAAALMAVGALALRTRSVVSRRLGGPLAGWLPVASATSILVVGVLVTARAVPQLG